MKGFWKVIVIVLIIIIVAAVVTGCYFLFRPKPKDMSIETENPYYIKAVIPGLFKYENNSPVSITTDDQSYCMISQDQKYLLVCFVNADPEKNAEFRFLITSYKSTKSGLSADVQIILDGKLLRCRLTTDKDYITIKCDLTRTVSHGINGVLKPNEKDNRNVTLLSFWREYPFIGGAP